MRVMAHADCIASHTFQLFETANPYFAGNSSSQGSGVMVNTDPFEFERLPVQEKAVIRIEGKVRIPTGKVSASRKAPFVS